MCALDDRNLRKSVSRRVLAATERLPDRLSASQRHSDDHLARMTQYL